MQFEQVEYILPEKRKVPNQIRSFVFFLGMGWWEIDFRNPSFRHAELYLKQG